MTPAFSVTINTSDFMLSIIRITIVTVVSIAAGGSSICAGQDIKPDDQWLTGRKLDQFNELAISVWWRDAELRERMMRFSQTQRIAVFLDRRVDPSMLVDLTIKNSTKEQFMWAVAKDCDLGACRIEDFYYFGPVESAAVLPSVCQQLRKESSKRRRSFNVDWDVRQPLKTSEVVEPKRFLLELAQANQFAIENPDAIPHDIWSGVDLPSSRLDTRVAILLAGFGKSFERNKDGTVITIVDVPEVQSTELVIRDLESPAEMAKILRGQFPAMKIAIRGKRLVADGTPIEIAAVQRAVIEAKKPIGGDVGEKTFTFTRRAMRGVILATAAQGNNSALVYDKSNTNIVKSLREPIEVNVVNADAAGLMEMALEGTNLTYELTENEVRITER